MQTASISPATNNLPNSAGIGATTTGGAGSNVAASGNVVKDSPRNLAAGSAGVQSGIAAPTAGAGARAGTTAVAVAGAAAGRGGSESPANPDKIPVAGGPAAGAGAGPTATGDCAASLLPVPDDLHMRGPWDAAVKTVKAGRLTLELFYPGEPGSGQGKPEASYTHSDWLPMQEQAKTPMGIEGAKTIGGPLYRDLPIDAAHGPYPVVIFVHGTASMRAASISTNAHWASRGFIVAVADYPGLGLTDQLSSACGYAAGSQDVEGDVRTQIGAIKEASGEFSFLAGHADVTRLALAGHSQGACMSATLAALENVRLVIPITGSTQVSPSPTLKSIMWIAGMSDTVIGYDTAEIGNVVCPGNPLPAVSNVDGFTSSPGAPEVTKRIAGIRGGGHLSVTDLCQVNSLGHTDLQQMQMDGICGVDSAVIIGLPALFDCGTADWKQSVGAVNYVSTAALEETLLCRDRTAQFAAIKQNVPELGDWRQEP